jgi:hypothetical protein
MWRFTDAFRADGQNWKALRPEDLPFQRTPIYSVLPLRSAFAKCRQASLGPEPTQTVLPSRTLSISL